MARQKAIAVDTALGNLVKPGSHLEITAAFVRQWSEKALGARRQSLCRQDWNGIARSCNSGCLWHPVHKSTSGLPVGSSTSERRWSIISTITNNDGVTKYGKYDCWKAGRGYQHIRVPASRGAFFIFGHLAFSPLFYTLSENHYSLEMLLTKSILHTTDIYIKKLKEAWVETVSDFCSLFPRDYEDKSDVLWQSSQCSVSRKSKR